MKIIIWLFRLGLGLALTGVCIVSFAAALGFASPLLDALNHLQPFLFAGTLILLILVVLTFRDYTWRSGLIALGASGFLASATIVIPEQVSGYFFRPATSAGQPTIKLFSHNLFGLNLNMARTAQVILDQDPDIIALQEFFDLQREGLHPLIVEKYPYFARCAGRKKSYVAIYSKTPFEVEPGTQCAPDVESENNPVARLIARFSDANGTRFNVVTTHLNWPVQVNPLRNDSLNFVEKLAAMTARKEMEWNELRQAVQGIEGPVILAGDFNSTSWSYAMKKFERDARLTRYSRGLLTYPKLFYIRGWRELPAIFPIDHFMADDEVGVIEVKTGAQTGSDHLPVLAQFFVGGL